MAIATFRGQEIGQAILNHIEKGGEVLLVTVTLRHHLGQSLEGLMDVLADSWRYMKSGTDWQGGKERADGTRHKGWKERLGYMGAISGTEVNYGQEYGWHPHKHILFFLEKRIPEETLDDFLFFLRGRWIRRVHDHHHYPAPTWKNGVTIVRGEKAGQYMAKMGLASELTGVHQKTGKNGSRTPFQLLATWVEEGENSGRKRWEEWTGVMKGRAQFFWSQGLRALLLPELEELTDEEIVEGEDEAEELIAVIPGEVWNQIRDRPGVPAEILWAADHGGDQARYLVQLIIARELHHQGHRGGGSARDPPLTSGAARTPVAARK